MVYGKSLLYPSLYLLPINLGPGNHMCDILNSVEGYIIVHSNLCTLVKYRLYSKVKVFVAFIIPRAIRPEVDKAIDTDTELYSQLLPYTTVAHRKLVNIGMAGLSETRKTFWKLTPF